MEHDAPSDRCIEDAIDEWAGLHRCLNGRHCGVVESKIAGSWLPPRFRDVTRERAIRFLLVEAAQVTVRSQPEWRSTFFHLAMRRGRTIAKIAMGRKLAVHLYWMWRQGWDYGQLQKLGSHAGEPGHRDGVQ